MILDTNRKEGVIMYYQYAVILKRRGYINRMAMGDSLICADTPDEARRRAHERFRRSDLGKLVDLSKWTAVVQLEEV